MKDKITNANNCPDYASDKCDCNYFIDCKHHTPLPEAQPLEGVKFTYPFRVGRKQNRAVLDANGIEVVVFKDGLQDMAINYCNMLNAQFATDAGGEVPDRLIHLEEAILILDSYASDEVLLSEAFDKMRSLKNFPAPSTHSSSEMVESPDWTQQDLTFKVSELIEHSFDVKYARTDTLINAYQIESSLHSIIDSLGLELVIKDRSKFECNLGGALDI